VETATPIEMPVAFALVASAVVAAFGWLTRRVYVAVPAVALTIVPMADPLGGFESAAASALPKTKQPAAQNAPTARQVAELYKQVGRELAEATKRDPYSTLDLWPRYRWVNFMDAIKTPAKRVAAAAVLEKLLVETRKLKP